MLEQLAHVLGGPAVLFGDGVGVVTGHLHGCPSHPCLLLGLGDDRVEHGRLEMSQRVQVDVFGDPGLVPDPGEAVAHG